MIKQEKKYIKYFFLLIVTLSIVINFNQTVFAGRDGETTEQSGPPVSAEQEDGENPQTSSATAATLSSLGYIQAATTVGTVWGGLKILDEFYS